MALILNSEYIKLSFSIGYFERYVNSESDYLELLSVDTILSAHIDIDDFHWNITLTFDFDLDIAFVHSRSSIF